MIELPWQIIAAFIALFGLHMIIGYLRRQNCDERVEVAKRQQHRDSMAIYREAYLAGWVNGAKDSETLTEEIDRA